MSISTPQRFFPNAISIFWLCSKNLNVPGVTQPALIDLYVWKATSIHHRWRISFFLKLSRRGTAVLPLAHICRQPTTWDSQGSQGYIQPEKKGLCRHHFSLTLPLYPRGFFCLLTARTLILTAYSISVASSKTTFSLCSLTGFFNSCSVLCLLPSSADGALVKDESYVIKYSVLSFSKASSLVLIFLPKGLQFKSSWSCLPWNQYPLRNFIALETLHSSFSLKAALWS